MTSPSLPPTEELQHLDPIDPAAVRKRLAHPERLPTLPTSFTKVVRITSNPNAGVTDLAEVINYDPALAAGILRVANSAYFGLREPVDDLPTALLHLGMAEVARIALSVGYFDVFAAKSVGVEFLKNIWLHSVATGLMSMRIATLGGFEFAQDAYSAGLLHDLGKIFFATAYPTTYAALRAQVAAGKADGITLERQIFGLSHVEAAFDLAQHWKLPTPMAEIATKHHDLSQVSAETQPMACCVVVANFFAHHIIQDEPSAHSAPFVDGWLAELAKTSSVPAILTREELDASLRPEAERARRFESTTTTKK